MRVHSARRAFIDASALGSVYMCAHSAPLSIYQDVMFSNGCGKADSEDEGWRRDRKQKILKVAKWGGSPWRACRIWTGNVLQSAKLLKCDSFCFSRTETLSCTGMLGMHSCSHTQTCHIFMRTLADNNTFLSSIRWTLKTTFYMTYDPLRHPVLKVTKALNQQSSQRQECKHTHTEIDRSQALVMTCNN